jgi:hypothetical protein
VRVDGGIDRIECNYKTNTIYFDGQAMKFNSRRGQCKLKGAFQVFKDIDKDLDFEVKFKFLTATIAIQKIIIILG